MDTCPNCGAPTQQHPGIQTRSITTSCTARCGWFVNRPVYVVPVDPADETNCEACQ